MVRPLECEQESNASRAGQPVDVTHVIDAHEPLVVLRQESIPIGEPTHGFIVGSGTVTESKDIDA